MTMQIIICDICSGREGIKRYQWCVDSEISAAGESEFVFESFDLCHTCLCDVLGETISDLQNELGMRKINGLVIQHIKRKVNP